MTRSNPTALTVPVCGSYDDAGKGMHPGSAWGQKSGPSDLEHTLNYLTFPDDPMLVSGPDQLQIDVFYRYNESLQRFFNGASSIATSYAT